jgi:hypothetical protein
MPAYFASTMPLLHGRLHIRPYLTTKAKKVFTGSLAPSPLIILFTRKKVSVASALPGVFELPLFMRLT